MKNGFLTGLEASSARSDRLQAGSETPRLAFVYGLCKECVESCIGGDRKPSKDAGLCGYTSDTKGVVKSKSPPQKRSSKVKAPFGFTRNRYPDVLYYRPTVARFVQPLDE